VVLVVGFPAQAFATNCYVLATEAGEECVVVDPGIGVLDELDAVLREHRLKPAAVLLTHGHLDHVYSVTPVCGANDVPAYIHGADGYRLADPYGSLDPMLVSMFEQQFGTAATWAEPDEVASLDDGTKLTVAGLDITVDHAPGHTEGSVMFRLPDKATDGQHEAQTCLSGDVLFAGSIGRTDLPGGDHAAMLRSLAEKVLPLPDNTTILPGHGPATTMARERVSNPFLQGLNSPTRP
jgi:glyoxylase-like metal-dependent hydrolase (beta-lactamase superfamily II)